MGFEPAGTDLPGMDLLPEAAGGAFRVGCAGPVEKVTPAWLVDSNGLLMSSGTSNLLLNRGEQSMRGSVG